MDHDILPCFSYFFKTLTSTFTYPCIYVNLFEVNVYCGYSRFRKNSRRSRLIYSMFRSLISLINEHIQCKRYAGFEIKTKFVCLHNNKTELTRIKCHSKILFYFFFFFIPLEVLLSARAIRSMRYEQMKTSVVFSQAQAQRVPCIRYYKLHMGEHKLVCRSVSAEQKLIFCHFTLSAAGWLLTFGAVDIRLAIVWVTWIRTKPFLISPLRNETKLWNYVRWVYINFIRLGLCCTD